MMATPDVWPAMADAYESATGPFGDRLLATLRAGEAAGGDARGRMSAAMLIVDGERQDEPWQGRLIDVRIDHTLGDPIAELERRVSRRARVPALQPWRATRSWPATRGAVRETDAGLDLLPGDGNLRFLRAGALLAAGDTDDGVGRCERCFASARRGRRWLAVFHERGLMVLPPGRRSSSTIRSAADEADDGRRAPGRSRRWCRPLIDGRRRASRTKLSKY